MNGVTDMKTDDRTYSEGNSYEIVLTCVERNARETNGGMHGVTDHVRVEFAVTHRMPDSLFGALMQGIMVVVCIKPCVRLSNDEYNCRDSLQARAIEGIGNYGTVERLSLECRN